jgi:hypothetical protein
MQIVNLTPHKITFMNDDNNVVMDVLPSGDVARVSSTSVVVDSVNGIDVCTTSFGDVVGLPDAVDGVVYIVSRMCKSAVSGRDDVLVPGDAVRNDDGNIVGCRNLSR